MAKKYDNPRIQALADRLHSDFCTSNHTDMCGYLYGGWGDVRLQWSRKTWYEKAERFMREQSGL